MLGVCLCPVMLVDVDALGTWPPGWTGVVWEPMWKKPVCFLPGGANCEGGGDAIRSPRGVPGPWATMLSLLWL
jgi:hypothetical protein